MLLTEEILFFSKNAVETGEFSDTVCVVVSMKNREACYQVQQNTIHLLSIVVHNKV